MQIVNRNTIVNEQVKSLRRTIAKDNSWRGMSNHKEYEHWKMNKREWQENCSCHSSLELKQRNKRKNQNTGSGAFFEGCRLIYCEVVLDVQEPIVRPWHVNLRSRLKQRALTWGVATVGILVAAMFLPTGASQVFRNSWRWDVEACDSRCSHSILSWITGWQPWSVALTEICCGASIREMSN